MEDGGESGAAEHPRRRRADRAGVADAARQKRNADQADDTAAAFEGPQRAEDRVGPNVGKLAEAGCDAKTIAAVLGHMTTTMAEHYSRSADRRHLAAAAIRKVERTKSAGKWKTERKTGDSEIS
jgi:hypothetical protein